MCFAKIRKVFFFFFFYFFFFFLLIFFFFFFYFFCKNNKSFFFLFFLSSEKIYLIYDKKRMYHHEPKQVDSIEFHTPSPPEIVKLSVVEVKYPTVDERKHVPKKYGLKDSSMGIEQRGALCLTCHSPIELCTGHFACNSMFAMPVFPAHYVSTILLLLKVVSFYDSSLLIHSTHKKYKDIMKIENISQRLQKLVNLCKKPLQYHVHPHVRKPT